MADDITLPGTAAVVATDDIGSGRQVQLVKPVFGADGTATMVSGTTPMPVALPPYQVLTGTASGTGVVIAAFEPNGYASLTITASGSFTGTVRLEFSLDGSTWSTQNMAIASNGQISGDFSGSSSITSGAIFVASLMHRYYRVNCSSYSSGTLSVTVGLNPAPLHAVRANITNSSLSVAATPSGVNSGGDGQLDNYWVRTAGESHGFNGTNWDRQRHPRLFKSVTATASGDTAVWVPTTGKRVQLLRFQVFATADAATASGGVITVTLRDNTTSTGLAIPVYVPATGGTTLGGWTSGWIDIGPYGFRSAAINTTLNVNLSAALTAGAIGVIACGTEE